VGLPDDPRVRAARELARTVLAPAAAAVEEAGIPRSHLDALAGAGLLGLRAPAADGGSDAPPAVYRAVNEVLAGADCTTWLVQAQHHGPVALLARSAAPVRDRLLHPLATGAAVAGTAFSHLRRYPADRVVRAEPAGDGWRFDGTVHWYTGWGVTDVLMLAGVSAGGEVVFGFAPAVEGPHLRPSPLRLAAMGGSRTVRLVLDGLVVPAGDVVARLPHAEWAAQDREATANANPACFGVARRAVELLAGYGDPDAVACAERLGGRLAAVRAECGRLADEAPPAEALEDRLDGRARAALLAVEATTALVTAGSGRAMAAGAEPERLARAALFLLVQAQTRAVRTALLGRLG
jgi:alkylation response protein AidB-like acyl-CoA dehydrogenase